MGEGKSDLCPKGKYKDSKCNDPKTMCLSCPDDTYIDVENKMDKCLPCRKCSSVDHLMIDEDCAADRNRRCKCMPGYFCQKRKGSECILCIPASKCPKGNGVMRNHTSTSNTDCKPCVNGTYNDVEDYWTPCKKHTSCDGFYLKSPGNSTSDAECGNLLPVVTDRPTPANITSCTWLLPAGLWAGFVITVLTVFLALFIIYWRNKRQPKITKITFSPVSPVLPPDILKYPADCDVEKCVACKKCLTLTGENYSDMDGSIQCDGVIPLKTVSEKYRPSAATNDFIDCFTRHSLYQSEPQESEWNDSF